MTTIGFKWLAALSSASLLLTVGSSAQAFSLGEVGDAGDTPGNATVATSRQVSPLLSISGSLSGNTGSGDADLFKIFLTGGKTFAATTRNSNTDKIPRDNLLGIPNDLAANPKLFLFDAAGKGIYANDNRFGSTQPTLLSGGFSPTASGAYFLGISGSGLEAISRNGQIFPSQSFDREVGPTGPGGGAPLIGFEGDGSDSSGKYTIALSGAQTFADPAAPVPEPASILGSLAAAAGLIVLVRFQRSAQESID